MNKQNKNKVTDIEKRLMVTRRKVGCGEGEMNEEVNCRIMDGN